jgi:hypothetical protein
VTHDEAVIAIEKAAGPGDLFPADGASRVYKRLAVLVHPDTHPGDSRSASAFKRLGELYDQQCGRVPAGPELAARGDIADLFRVPGAAAVLKMPRDPADNDLMAREITALTALHRTGSEYLPFIPELAGSGRQRDPATGAVRRTAALGWLDGFVSLEDVAIAYPAGIDGRDAAWMWRRLLTVLGFAHHTARIIHGAVLPPHVMIHPEKHGLVLVDWCYSATGGARIPAIVDRYRDWYPPEVTAKETPGPHTDIAMAAATMTGLMAGQAPWQLTSFAAGCQLSRPDRRPGGAWPLIAELDELLERLYGPRKFHPFTMPA